MRAIEDLGQDFPLAAVNPSDILRKTLQPLQHTLNTVLLTAARLLNTDDMSPTGTDHRVGVQCGSVRGEPRVREEFLRSSQLADRREVALVSFVSTQRGG